MIIKQEQSDTITTNMTYSILFQALIDNGLITSDYDTNYIEVWRYHGIMESKNLLETDSTFKFQNLAASEVYFSTIYSPNFRSYVYDYNNKESDSFDKLLFIKYSGTCVADLKDISDANAESLLLKYNYRSIFNADFHKIHLKFK